MSAVQNPPVTLQAKVSKTATFDGTGVDISALPANSQIKVKIDSLTAAKNVVFAVEDSVDAFNSDSRIIATVEVKGPIVAEAPREFVVEKFRVPSARFGVGSATMRLSILSIDSATTVVYESFIPNGTL